MKSAKPRILFILHLPPPVHGPSKVGECIRNSPVVGDAFETRFLNLSTSASLKDIGRVGFRKFRTFLRLRRSVREALETFSPDLVYMTPSVWFPGVVKDWLLARTVRKSGCKIVFHLHNKGTSTAAAARIIYRSLFAGSDVILLSRLLYPDIAPYVPESRIRCCWNGVDAMPVPHRGTEDGVPEILFLSNLLPDKGIEDLLEACRILKRQGIPFRCRFVGAPSAAISAESFNGIVKEHGLESVVRYDGPLYGDRKVEAFSRADIFVHPSREDCFPLVVLEAMAAGLPVVSTLEGGIPDEVAEGETGLLCPKADPEALARALGLLLTDPDMRRRMGEAGRHRYELHFTRKKFEERLTALLQSCV